MKEYRVEVLHQKDGVLITAKFDPKWLEKQLNNFSKEGWRILSVSTLFIPNMAGPRQRQLVIMERDK